LPEGASARCRGLAALPMEEAIDALGPLLLSLVEGALSRVPRHRTVVRAEAVVFGDDDWHGLAFEASAEPTLVAGLVAHRRHHHREGAILPLPQVVCMQVEKIERRDLVGLWNCASHERGGDEYGRPASLCACSDAGEQRAVLRPQQARKMCTSLRVVAPVALVAHVKHHVTVALGEQPVHGPVGRRKHGGII